MYTLAVQSLSPKLYYSSLVSNLTLISTAFVFILILFVVYMSKKNMDNIENKLYRLLIFLSTIELGAYILNMVGDLYWPNNYFVLGLTIRIRMTAEIIWFCLIDLYRIVILQHKRKDNFELWFNKNKKIIYTVLISVLCIFGILSFTLPMEISVGEINPLRHQSDGLAYHFWMGIFVVLILLYFLLVLLSIGKIEKKKVFPFLVNDIFMGSAFIHPLFRDLSIPMVTRTLIVYVMYNTIENPDIKMVNELTLAKNQAEQANNAKSDFLSSMSHELRTPLNAIVGLSQMIKNGDNVEEMRNDSEDILVASENLLELVDGILDINKLEANKMELIEVNYKPKDIFNDLERMIKVRIGDKNLELRITISDDIPYELYGDRDKVKRIISNLLTSAVKYTEEGYIDFVVDCINQKDKCTLKITVKDTGRVISEERIPILFTKFNRLESDKDSNISGTGLGLAITKSLVDLVGGKISVNSTLDVGTTFMVTLTQDIVQQASPGGEKEIVKQSHNSVENNTTQEIKNEVENQKEEDNTSNNKKKLLIVDDNKLNLKVASKILENFNFDVETSNSGFECIDKINNQNKYDLIFMDIMMPEMDGVETMKKLKNMSLSTPIVALTADAVEGSRERYLEEGFDDYVAKPIDQMTLEETLSKLLHLNVITEHEANSYKENYNNTKNDEEVTEIL